MLVAAMAGTVSCRTELLDPKPRTDLPAAVVFDTPQRIEQQVNGLYDAVKNGQFLGGRYLIYNDIRAEDFINRQNNSVTGLQTWNHTLVETNNEVNNLWVYAYQAINASNVFLKGLEDNASRFVQPAFPDDFASVRVPQYQAEARFLRGISYYYLLQLYARPYIDGNGSRPGLPLRLQAETDFSNNDLARSTVAETYAQVLTDLDFAEQNLPLTAPVSRAHRNAAIAFKTRVYLTMGRWNDVVTEANKIVSEAPPFKATTGVQHQLSPSIRTVFAPPQTTPESIFSLPSTALDAPGTQNQLAFYYLPNTRPNPSDPTGGAEYSLNPSGIIADPNWKATDERRQFIIPISAANWGGDQLLGQVFDGYALHRQRAHHPLRRGAAEPGRRPGPGRGERGREVGGPAQRRTGPLGRHHAVYAGGFPDLNAFTSALLQERRIEFLGEGMRSIDLMRLNLPIPAKGTAPGVLPSDPNYVWPIPSSELSANRSMERN
jgi:hypothetical protein